MQELGTGVFGWNGEERRSDRYGVVHLYVAPHNSQDVRLTQIKEGVRGKLVAIVKETRESHHIGDLFHGVFPVTPKVGERIVLGEGSLFYEEGGVGLRPDDGRDDLWLDIHSLYRAHDQTVTLVFEEPTQH